MTATTRTIQIHNKLRLDKRKAGNNWCARLTLRDGSRIVRSTKTDNFADANEIALEMY